MLTGYNDSRPSELLRKTNLDYFVSIHSAEFIEALIEMMLELWASPVQNTQQISWNITDGTVNHNDNRYVLYLL